MPVKVFADFGNQNEWSIASLVESEWSGWRDYGIIFKYSTSGHENSDSFPPISKSK